MSYSSNTIGGESLTTNASQNTFWAFLKTISISTTRFLTTILLARLLSPQDFGILGMAVLFMDIVNLFGNIGVGGALIQRKEIDDRDVSTVYWANFCSGLILTVLCLVLSPVVATFFHEPILTSIIVCLSLNFIFSAMASTYHVLMMRSLNFKSIAIIEMISTGVRVLITLILAMSGFGVWSLIMGMIGERIVKTCLFAAWGKWRIKLLFDKERFKGLFHFGKNLYGICFLNYFNSNIDYIVTGRFLGSANLGYYQFSFALPHLVLTHIVENILDVVYPLYCKVHDEKDRILRGFLKTINFISIVTFPLMFALFFMAEDFILLVYGVRWTPSIIPLKILCLSGAVLSITSVSSTLCISLGRPDVSLKWQSFMLPLTIVAVWIGSRWGINGVASAMALMASLNLILAKISLKFLNASFRSYFAALTPAFISSSMMILSLYLFNKLLGLELWPRWSRFLTDTGLGVMIYFCMLQFGFPEDFNELKSFGKRMFKKTK